jgi:hypothetical protein
MIPAEGTNQHGPHVYIGAREGVRVIKKSNKALHRYFFFNEEATIS